MAVQTRAAQLKFRDTAPKSIGQGQVQAASWSVRVGAFSSVAAANAASAPTLVEGTDYEVGKVNAAGALVAGPPYTAIRALAPREGMHTVFFGYEDVIPVPPNPYDAPVVVALEAARAALVTAMTDPTTGINAVNTGIQGLGASPTTAALSTAIKALSASQRAYDVAANSALDAIKDALVVLKNRG